MYKKRIRGSREFNERAERAGAEIKRPELARPSPEQPQAKCAQAAGFLGARSGGRGGVKYSERTVTDRGLLSGTQAFHLVNCAPLGLYQLAPVFAPDRPQKLGALYFARAANRARLREGFDGSQAGGAGVRPARCGLRFVLAHGRAL